MSREVHEVRGRRELLADEHLIDRMGDGAEFRLHHPVPREVSFVTDEPWEGSQSTNFTVFQDEDRYRMYYLAWNIDLENSTSAGASGLCTPHELWMCYAESSDGLSWHKPELGLYEFEGSRENNIIWRGEGPKRHGLKASAVFRDSNPDCDPQARYKAVGPDLRSCQGDLYALGSPDGINWSLLSEEPILLQGKDGRFACVWLCRTRICTRFVSGKRGIPDSQRDASERRLQAGKPISFAAVIPIQIMCYFMGNSSLSSVFRLGEGLDIFPSASS